MRSQSFPVIILGLLAWTCAGRDNQTNDVGKAARGKVVASSEGLHGYIGFSATRPPARSEYSAGMGFYSAVWPLIDQPLADFQIGLAGAWITPDNSDKIPETWSKIGKLFQYPFIYGRGLDARPGNMGGGAMEINTVPRFDSQDERGVVYSKIPRLHFPVDEQGRTFLVQDVAYYSKEALYDAFKAWRDGGPAYSGRFDEKGAWKSTLTTKTTRYDQAGKKVSGVERVFDTKVFEGNVWGLKWNQNDVSPQGLFPQYYKQVGQERVAVAVSEVPAETRLLSQEFKLAKGGEPYTSPTAGAWSRPGPKRGPFTVKLADGSVVTFSWYRFVDQPSFQQYNWGAEKKAALQALVEKIHANWPIDRYYMAAPSRGVLVTLDPALIVTPPEGMEVGYVPIVTGQTTREVKVPRKEL